MRYAEKRTKNQDLENIQEDNRRWWTTHTMSYDWRSPISAEMYSSAWFDEIDRRFIYSARLFAHDASAFDRIIPFEALKDKRVLEIGCGMGLHAELMARAGAKVVAIDISETSVMATRKRAALKKLSLDVRQMDAAKLDFEDQGFDFVWSWGAIHHAAQTGRIVKDIHRVLRPGGEVRAMVYNLDGMPAYITIATKHLLNFWRGRSLDQNLWQSTGGFLARHYTKDLLADLFNTFFFDTRVVSYGQDADAVPLPRYFRKPLLRFFDEESLKRWANSRGAFLFVTARK
ncbi:MAG: class I SAM-dependent methyltransferase [Rhizobiales bacterium]|nr:class I SAM-dependent methyltransferase [Hyphomicrobiales bacterium]